MQNPTIKVAREHRPSELEEIVRNAAARPVSKVDIDAVLLMSRKVYEEMKAERWSAAWIEQFSVYVQEDDLFQNSVIVINRNDPDYERALKLCRDHSTK